MKLFKWAVVLSVVMISLGALGLRGDEPVAQDTGKSGPQTKIKISKETTYITEPLRPDGYPDYVAALNQRMSTGVTPKNNAAVLLVTAVGPDALQENIRADTLKQLGLSDLPEQGNYIVSQSEIIKRWRAEHPDSQQESVDALSDQFDDAESRPWSKEEFPWVAKWLSLNEKPLEIICRAVELPKYYFPYVSKQGQESSIIALPLPLLQIGRETASLLATRAMWRLKQNDLDGAWEDLRRCHRIARLDDQGPLLIEALVGYAVDQMAIRGDITLAHYAKLSDKQRVQMQTDLRTLPPLADVVSKLDISERFMCLDIVTACARGGATELFKKLAALTSLTGKHYLPSNSISNVAAEVDQYLDWNAVTRELNQRYDRFISIGRIADVRKRREALRKFDQEVRAMQEKITDSKGYCFEDYLLKAPHTEISQRVANVFAGLLMPALNAIIGAEERSNLGRQMEQVAFALAAYRADRGQYPETLDALVPNYIAEAPDDTFAEKPTPIRYERTADAWRMWSVGNNGIDDGGRNQNDDPKGDDWVLEPAVKK